MADIVRVIVIYPPQVRKEGRGASGGVCIPYFIRETNGKSRRYFFFYVNSIHEDFLYAARNGDLRKTSEIFSVKVLFRTSQWERFPL
jgi:hypothetical protein